MACIYLLAASLFSYVSLLLLVVDYTETTKSLFITTSLLAKADNQYRTGLQFYNERFLFLNSLLYPQLWVDRLTESQVAYRLNMSEYARIAGVATMSSEFFFGYLTKEASAKATQVNTAINNFANNQELMKLDLDTRNLLLSSRLQLKTYRDFSSTVVSQSSLGIVTYLRVFLLRLRIFAATFVTLQPYMDGKKPPFSFPAGLLKTAVRDTVPGRLATIQGGFDGVITFLQGLLTQCQKLVAITHPEKFQVKYKIVVPIGIIALILGIAIIIYVGYLIKRRLWQILTAARFVKGEEVSFMSFVAEKKLNHYKRSKLNEMTLVEVSEMFSHRKTSTKKLGGVHIQNINVKKTSSLGIHKKKARTDVKADFMLRSMKAGIMLTILGAVVFGFLYIGFSSVYERVNTAISSLTFYFGVLSRINKASNYYLYHSVFIIYGNFVLIDGQLASDLMKTYRTGVDPIEELISYSNTNRVRFSEYLGKTGGEAITKALYGDLCSLLAKSRPTYKEDLLLCQNNLFAKSGFLAFLNGERKTLEDIRLTGLSNADFLERTKTDFLVFPFQEFLFAPDMLKFRFVHKIMFETSVTQFLTLGEAFILDSFTQLNDLITYVMKMLFSILLFGFLITYVIVSIWVLKKDLEICAEPLTDFLPEVVYQNKMVLKLFKETFANHL